MADLSGLTPITTAATALSNLVVVTPQQAVGYVPQSDFLSNKLISYQNAILFNYEGEQSVQIQSDITDHYIEDNTAIQDQVSLKPVKITTHGFIGELNDVAPFPLQVLQQIANKLTIISAYAPVLSTTALIAYNEAFQAYQVVTNAAKAAVSAWASLGGLNQQAVLDGNADTAGVNFAISQNKQQTAFQQFYGYWANRTFFTVQTPWAVFVNMMIESLRAVQDAETQTITDFEITFKQIRLATSNLITNEQAENILQGRLNEQAATNVDLGTSGVSQALQIDLALFIP